MSNFEERYNTKVKSCKERMIQFDLSLAEWTALLNMQYTETCAYTNQKFKNQKDKFPTVERINDNIGYTKNNVCLVTSRVNSLKNDYVFLGKSTKGLNSTELGYVHRIKKVLSCQENIDRILKPYKKVFKEVNEQKTSLAQENLKEVEKQRVKQAQIAKEKALEKTYEEECTFALHYVKLAEEFSQGGITMQLTIGELKKKLNTKACSVTGVKFNSTKDKYIFVNDLTKPVTKDNISVVTYEAREALYTLLKGTDIKTVGLNLHKLQNKLGE